MRAELLVSSSQASQSNNFWNNGWVLHCFHLAYAYRKKNAALVPEIWK